MSYRPPGHRCIRIPLTLFVQKWVQMGEGGLGVLSTDNSKFGRCVFLYFGAFLGWPAEEGKDLNLFWFKENKKNLIIFSNL